MTRSTDEKKSYRISIYNTDYNATEATNGKLVDVESLAQLADLASKQSWSPSVFRNNYRRIVNFVGCDLIGLDVDDGCTLNEARQHFSSYKHIIYTTRHHQKVKNPGTKSEKPACDRFRVVLVLSHPIVTEHEYNLTFASLQKKFPFIDPNAKDAARFFYPGTPISCVDAGEDVVPVTSFSRRTSKFITHGAAPGEWNHELYCASKDIQEQLYDIDSAIELLERPASLPGNLGYLDEADIATIKSAFRTPPGNPPRVPYELNTDEDGNVKIELGRLVTDLIDPYFVQHISDDATVHYRISNPADREVARCKNKDVLLRHVASELEALPFEVRSKVKLENLLTYWRYYGKAIIEAPASFAWADDEGWAVRRMNFTPAPGDWSAWKEFTSRLSDEDAFMGFVWSAFELKNKSRQAVWLYGPHGQDGKSSVMRVLADCFGNASAALNNTQIRSDSRFTLANFYNKRFVIYPDAKNSRFPMSELFRNITSGDVVPIEFKGEGTINACIYVKLMVGSNTEPELTSSNADSSRLIRIDVEPSKTTDDVDWEAKLVTQLPSFLHECQLRYKKVCPKHGQIRVSDYSKEILQDSSDQFQEQWTYIFEKDFERGPGFTVSASDLYEHLTKTRNLMNNAVRDFHDYLRHVHKITKKKVADETGIRKNVYVGVRLKNSAPTTYTAGIKRGSI